MKIGPRVAAILLVAIVAGASALALKWVFLVPIYQSPDEPQHLDYALAIRDGGRLFRAEAFRADVVTYAHPWSAYLVEKTGFDAVAFNRAARMEPGYGSRRLYRAWDRDAPLRETIRIARPPMLASVYPYGYYLLLAGWLEVVGLFTDRVTTTFFAARGLSVAMLAFSLILGYMAARELRIGRGMALAATAIVGFFPMTTFVASYVQPDNLAFALVSLGLYLALRAARRGGPALDLTLLGLCWGALLATKPHFFACLVATTLPLLATRIPRRRWPLAILLLGWSLPLFWAPFAWIVGESPSYYSSPTPGDDVLTTATERLGRALDNYLKGPTHEGFWGLFGWLDAPIELGMPRRAGVALRFLAMASTWMVLGLVLARIERVGSRIVRVAMRGRPGSALRIAASDPIINLYFLFFALMVYAFVRMDNRFAAQGRNWVPVMLPIVLLAIRYAPRALTLRRAGTIASAALAAALLVYVGLGSAYGLHAIRARYYLPAAARRVALDPSSAFTHAMTWSAGKGATLGPDSHLGYALPGPRMVRGLELDLVLDHDAPAGERVVLAVAWANTRDPSGAPAEQTRVFSFPPSAVARRKLFIPVGATVDAFRINPDRRACRVEVRGIALRVPIDRVAARR